MQKLLTTTALAVSLTLPAGLAMPVMAQSDDQQAQSDQTSGNQTAQAQDGQSSDPQAQMQQMGITASNLIGHRLYMPQAQDGQTDTAQTDMTAEEEAEVAEGGVEGEAEELEQQAETEMAEAGQAVDDMMQEIGNEIADVPENWQMVGDIDDVVITQEGEVRALVVDAGGFLGAGETQKRVDISNVRFVRDSDDEGEYFVVFAGNRQTLEQQENFDQAAAEQEGEMLATEDEETRQQMAEQGRSPDQQQQGETVDWADVTTEELLGARVYGQNDEWVGDLSELNLADDGSIQGAIIDVGGFLGIGEKPVQVSLDQLSISRTAGAFGDDIRVYVNATEEELEAMDEWIDNDL